MHPSCSYLLFARCPHCHPSCQIVPFMVTVIWVRLSVERKFMFKHRKKSPRTDVPPLLPQQPSMPHLQNRRPVENIKDTAYQHLKSVSAAGRTAGRTTDAQRCSATAKSSKKKTRCHANHIVVLSSGVETTHPKTPRLGSRLLATRKIIGQHRTPDQCTSNSIT